MSDTLLNPDPEIVMELDYTGCNHGNPIPCAVFESEPAPEVKSFYRSMGYELQWARGETRSGHPEQNFNEANLTSLRAENLFWWGVILFLGCFVGVVIWSLMTWM